MPDSTKKKIEAVPVPQVVTRGNILLLLAAAAILVALLIWGFFGTIKTSFTSLGALTTSADAIMVHQPENAVVTDIMVSTNQFVNKGDVLVRVYTETPGETVSMEQMAMEAHDIKSPVSGFVTEIIARQWQRVDLTTTLARVVESETDTVTHVLAYVPIEYVEKVEVGTRVNVNVQNATEEEVGVLTGTVTSVTDIPVSEYHILRSTGSEKVLEYFYQGGKEEQYEVLIELDTNDAGELVTTNNSLRKNSYVCNEMCQITFFSDEMHPYEVIYGN